MIVSTMIRYVVGQVASDRCLFIFDTCSLSSNQWQNYGINPKQIAYSDQICTEDYNKHGSAVIYTALQEDPNATVYFYSVFDKYGVGSNEQLFSKRKIAQETLAKLRAERKCTTYAGASFAGRGLITDDQDTLQEYSNNLAASTFDIDLWSSGNDYMRQKQDVCKQVIGPALKLKLNQANNFNYTGPLNIVTAYYDHADTIIAPEYSNIEGSEDAGKCVDLGATTNQILPEGLYSKTIFGGTSGATARATGIISNIAMQLKQNGLLPTTLEIRSFLHKLALNATDPNMQEFPIDVFGKRTVAIQNPGLKILSAENVQALIFSAKQTKKTTRYLRGSLKAKF